MQACVCVPNSSCESACYFIYLFIYPLYFLQAGGCVFIMEDPLAEITPALSFSFAEV